MAVTLNAAFVRQLKQRGRNTPNVLMEVALDAGTEILSYYGPNAGGTGALPSNTRAIIRNVTSTQNTLDTKKGWASRGQISFEIIGRENFRALIQNNYLKNRRVVKKEGFIGDGYLYSEYVETFWGKIVDWERRGDTLTVYVADDMVDTSKKVPVVNSTKTQSLSYGGGGDGVNPVDIMTNLLITQAGIDSAYVDSTKFESERDNWLASWRFFRVLTEAKDAKDYLNELQIESNSFIIHDGQKVSYKVFAPPLPSETTEVWSDTYQVVKNSLSCSSGYVHDFYNAVVVYFDYMEDGSKGATHYESVELLGDADSASGAQWDETKTKYIYCNWIRSLAFAPPTTAPITGVVMYHVSNDNSSEGEDGELYFTYSVLGDHTLKWKPPGGSSVFGAAVTIAKDGKYQLIGDHPDKSVRVVVTYADLPVANNSDLYTINALNGSQYARTIGNKILNRFRDPSSSVEFEIDLNSVAYDDGGGYAFVQVADTKFLTTDDAFEFGDSTWVEEPVLITSVRADFLKSRLKIKAIETKVYRRISYIAPNGQADYTSATDAEKKYGYIGRASDNKVNAGTEEGYFSW